MKTLRILSRIIVSIVFLFSGFVKAIDPLGSTYKFQDYFLAFNWEFLVPAALPLAILLSTAELIIGFALFTGLRMKITSWVLFVFMAFFTILTFIIAIKNPVTDCGCFGDALILTNWETFYKNVTLLIPTIFILLQRKKFETKYLPLIEYSFILSFTFLSIVISIYSLRNLPPLDFRPYKTGTHIKQNMIIPEGAPQDIYKNLFYYRNKNTGEVKEFDESNYPWQDTINWEFDRMADPILIEKGYEPPIHDFSISTPDGYDITESVLEEQGYTFLLISHNISKSEIKGLLLADQIATWAFSEKIPFYGLTASPDEEINRFLNRYPVSYSFNLTDEVTLKTIIRANPGLLLLKDGNIIGKWHYNNFPTVDEIDDKNLMEFSIEMEQKKQSRYFLIASIFLFLLLITSVKILMDKVKD